MSPEPSVAATTSVDLFAENLAALRKNNPPLAARLRETPEPQDVEILTAPRGGLTLRLRGRSLHSPFAPGSEMNSAVQEALATDPDWVIGFGMGLGYGLEMLRHCSRARIVVLEPALPMLRAVLQRIDVTHLLEDERILLIHQPEELTPSFWANHRLGDRVGFAIHPVYQELFPGELAELLNKVRGLFNDAVGGKQTQVARSRTWLDHTLRSLPTIVERPMLARLKDRFRGKPGILVSAGPSLAKNVHLLHELEGKALVVCVGTALLALLRRGIVPDLCVAIESEDIHTQFEADLSQVRLVLAPHVHPTLFALQTKRTLVVAQSANPAGIQLTAALGAASVVRESGTVATTAFSCLDLLGCDPIVLIGQDLAYSGGRQYAPGTLFEQMRYTLSADGQSIEQQGLEEKIKIHARGRTPNSSTQAELGRVSARFVRGLDGTMLPTTAPFLTSLQWFERVSAGLRTRGKRPVNATEGGAFIPGFEHTTLASVLDTLPPGAVDAGILDEIEPIPDARERVAETLEASRRGAEEAGTKAGEVRRLVAVARDRMGERQGEAALEELAKAEIELRELCARTPMLDMLVQKALLTARDLMRPDAAESPRDSLRISLDQAEVLFRALQDGAKELSKRLLESAEGLNQRP
jgi:hypothetical protein